METSTKQKIPVFQVNFEGFIHLIATILLLIGIYASLRTMINMKFFDKYPTAGVLTLSFVYPPYYPKEEDCFYSQPYFDEKGKIRKATIEELSSEKIAQQRCVNDVKNTRENTKMNDINMSTFFLFLGAGILITKKFFFK
jgi:hypothetical protein